MCALQVRGDAWRQMTLRTALLFPGVASVIFFTLNILIWGQDSSGAVSFSTLFALCFLWFGVSVPLVFTGSYFGYKRAPDDEPVRTNKIPRQVLTPLHVFALSPHRLFTGTSVDTHAGLRAVRVLHECAAV